MSGQIPLLSFDNLTFRLCCNWHHTRILFRSVGCRISKNLIPSTSLDKSYTMSIFYDDNEALFLPNIGISYFIIFVKYKYKRSKAGTND